jgi:uncharacterized protein
VRVLVSGSRGFIGTELVSRLAAGGHEVVRLVRPSSQPSATNGANQRGEVPWEPEAGRLDPARLEGIDAAVHLAGEGIATHRWSAAQKARIRDSRVKGTGLLATTLARLDPLPSVLVSASAVGVYGDRHAAQVTEDDPPGTGFLSEVCVAWEAATAPAEAAGIRVVHARNGVVLSPKGGALAKQLPLFRLALGGRLGSGRQAMSWISLEDEVAALEFALTNATLRGPINCTSPHPVDNREFTQALGRVLGRPAVLPVPRAALAVVLGRGLADEMLMAGAKVLPSRLQRAGFQFRHPDVEDALRAELGRR